MAPKLQRQCYAAANIGVALAVVNKDVIRFDLQRGLLVRLAVIALNA